MITAIIKTSNGYKVSIRKGHKVLYLASPRKITFTTDYLYGAVFTRGTAEKKAAQLLKEENK